MKVKNGLIVMLAALIGFGISAFAQQNAINRKVVEFEIEITVDRENNGVNMKCIEGCMWETLSFGCGGLDIDCASSIDESGTPAL
jgi:hypothetical protein